MSTSIFTGSSNFSADFQSVISRAVAIASLPMRQVQTEVQTLTSQSSELTSISTAFGSLQSALDAMEASLGPNSYGAAVTSGEVVSASLEGTPLPGNFSVEVLDLGVYAASMSSDGLPAVADAALSNISDSSGFTLQVGTGSYTISPARSTLAGLAEAINLSDANVQATVVNIGSPSSPDYRLSLQGVKLGDIPIQLTAIGGSSPGAVLMSSQTTGAPAQYRVNGQPAIPISSDTRTVTISTGVTVRLLGEGATDIAVTRSTNAASSSLIRFAAAYNAARTAIDHNRGEGGGALQGQSILMTLTDGLHRLAHYSSGQSGIASLAALGLSFDNNGALAFDSAVFSQATSGNIAQLSELLGSQDGGGFLKTAHDTLSTLADKENGALVRISESVRDQIASANQSIAEKQERIDTLERQLQARMAAADAAIAALEQQASYFTDMFTAMRESQRQ
jgi:flagellar hook-associated protein 2